MSQDPFLLVVDAILFFLAPGGALVLALFPRRRLASSHGWAYFTFIAVVASAAITILLGAALGFAPTSEGLFTGAATGAPILEVVVGLTTMAFLWIAKRRGAFANGLLPPQDAPAVIEVPSPHAKAARLEELQLELYRLRKADRRSSADRMDRGASTGHAERLSAVEGEISSLESEIR
jgi:hypothetical protein